MVVGPLKCPKVSRCAVPVQSLLISRELRRLFAEEMLCRSLCSNPRFLPEASCRRGVGQRCASEFFYHVVVDSAMGELTHALLFNCQAKNGTQISVAYFQSLSVELRVFRLYASLWGLMKNLHPPCCVLSVSRAAFELHVRECAQSLTHLVFFGKAW